MKISEETVFPHPVLSPWSTDIAGAIFSAELTVREELDFSRISISCEASLNHPDLTRMINSGEAQFGCFVSCVETGCRRLIELNFPLGSYCFQSGELLGRISFRPLIWTCKVLPAYLPAGVNPEFGGPVLLQPGEILAMGIEVGYVAERPPLPTIESLFEIKASAECEEGRFVVDLEGDKITVLMGSETFILVQSLRSQSGITKDVIFNSLYVPVVMQVLSDIGVSGEDRFQAYRWFLPFQARCQDLGVELKHGDTFSNAQEILGNPFLSLKSLTSD
jgi:hypothetical protein